MAEWKSADMAGLLPAEFLALLDTASTTVSGLVPVFQAVRDLIDAAKSFLPSYPPFDFASALADALTTFKNDFLASGIYACNMWDYPLRQYYRSGITGESFSNSFSHDLRISFTDQRDPNVPPFSTTAGMLVLVGGTPGLPEVRDAIQIVQEAFSWWAELEKVLNELGILTLELDTKEVEEALRKGEFDGVPRPSYATQLLIQVRAARRELSDLTPAEIEEIRPDLPTPPYTTKQLETYLDSIRGNTETSLYPDWQQISLRTILPPLVDSINQVMDPMVSALQSGADAVATAESLIAAIEAKIDILESIVTRVAEYIAQMENLLSLTGLYALWVDSSTGVDGLASGLENASNPPFAGENAFYFGLALVAGGPSLTAFSNLFKPIAS